MAFSASAALLDACVLALLDGEDMYGYLLTQNIQKSAGVSESTLYPVLRRLQKDNCLDTYDMACQGRNRRYYTLTERGARQLAKFRLEWEEFRKNIDQLLLGGQKNEPK